MSTLLYPKIFLNYESNDLSCLYFHLTVGICNHMDMGMRSFINICFSSAFAWILLRERNSVFSLIYKGGKIHIYTLVLGQKENKVRV